MSENNTQQSNTNNINQPVGENYTADSIQVLEGLEAVRKRPGMYIGNVNELTGLHQLVYEVVDNAIDESLAGFCDEIIVTIHEDNTLSVSDNGRGIPVGMHKKEQVSAAQVIMTVLHAGGKFDNNSYKVSGGLHGVGVSCVNALSQWLQLDIYRDGYHHRQEYERGIPKYELKKLERSKHSGTTITFKADSEIFTYTAYDFDALSHRLRELSYLNSGVRIQLIDERDDRELTFEFAGGIASFVDYLARNKDPIHADAIHILKEIDDEGITVEIAMQWTAAYKEQLICFANNIRNRDGGTHETAFKTALTRVVNQYINDHLPKLANKGSLSGEDIREGIVAIISVKLPDPTFSNQTKDKLLNSNISPHIQQAIGAGLGEWLLENPTDAHKVIEKALLARDAREAARNARERQRNKGMSSTTLPGKLSDCAPDVEPQNREIYLVEGESAGGTAKQGRNRKFQAILPLKGKILNVEKARYEKMLESQEIKVLISALGCGLGDEFDMEKLRYHRIVIMTDADVDGSHIRTLLLTFFFRQMPELVEQGYVYIAQPPLYKIKRGKQERYIKNEAEFEDYLLNCAIANTHVYNDQDEKLSDDDLKKLIKRTIRYHKNLKRMSADFDTRIIDKLIRDLQIERDIFYQPEQFQAAMQKLTEHLDAEHLDTLFHMPPIDVDDDGAQSLTWQTRQEGSLKLTVIDEDLLHHAGFQKLQRLHKSIAQKMTSQCRVLIGNAEPITLNEPMELRNIILDNAKKGQTIQRYKGLGEMNAEQLWETTMDPLNRTLLQVKVKDGVDADNAFTVLMGELVEPRREFIINNATQVRNLDI